MDKTEFMWFNGKLVKWEEIKISPLSHSLHYGSGVFEGERFYESAPNETCIFRLQEHSERLFYSAKCLKMDIPYSVEEISQATIDTVKSTKLTSGYIRPLCFFGEKMGLNPAGAPVETLIAAWGWGKYLADKPLSVKISKYVRIHPQSTVADAKISGHYVNSIMASQEIEGKYDEGLLLDFEGNVAEGPGENLFVVKNGEISTPSTTSGRILKGITRDTIITLAKDLGYKIVERTIKPEELFEADELFFTGSAAEVGPIGMLDDKKIGNGEEGPVCSALKKAYFEVVTGKNPKYEHWITRVKVA
jgi:branched-chain amino acid aminotransferase